MAAPADGWIDRTSVEAHAPGEPASRADRDTISAATRKMPTTRIDSATVTAVSAARATLRVPIGTPATRAPFLVDDDRGEGPVEELRQL